MVWFLHGGRLLSAILVWQPDSIESAPTAAYQPSTKLGTPSQAYLNAHNRVLVQPFTRNHARNYARERRRQLPCSHCFLQRCLKRNTRSPVKVKSILPSSSTIEL